MSIRSAVGAIGLAIVSMVPFACAAQGVSAPGPVEALKIAVDAYVFGYPLVTFDMVRQQQTNVAAPDAEHAPMGQLIKMRSYPAVDNHCCAAPNADTLYTMIWLDVSKEPAVFAIPAMGERYYIMPFVDGWSEVFGVASAPLNVGAEQTYAITGLGWTGTVPEGLKEIKSPTGMVWVLGRIYADGTDADYAAVHALQDQFKVTPLSAWGTDYAPPSGTVNPAIDMTTAVRKQVDGLSAEAYFDRLSALMVDNPPTALDAPMVAQMARIGIVPGQHFDPDKLGLIDRVALDTVPKLGLLKMGEHLKKQPTTNGWLYFTKGVGNWGTDYLLRGMGNLLGPGWNRPQDAVYPLSQKDAEGRDYDGKRHDYTIRFEKWALPPAKAFWSLTLYDTDYFFVPNPINRYELSQRDKLVAAEDGSVTLYVQADNPGPDKEANWLPAPKGKFALVMRLYDPSTTAPSLLDGSWTPPGVTAVP